MASPREQYRTRSLDADSVPLDAGSATAYSWLRMEQGALAMMTKHEVFAFIAENPVFFIATCLGGTPYVRAMMLYRADDEGIVFNTGRNKQVREQLDANPEVEMCFYSGREQTQVRIKGRVENVKDMPLRREVAMRNPGLRKPLNRCLKQSTTWSVNAVMRTSSGVPWSSRL